MIYLYLSARMVIVCRVGRVWLYAYHHFMLVVYSRCFFRVSTRTCFGLSVQSRLNPLLDLFGPRATLSTSLSLRVNHHDSAKLTTSNSNESLNVHHHALIFSVAMVVIE